MRGSGLGQLVGEDSRVALGGGNAFVVAFERASQLQ
jgi:hypothetical protein